MYLDTFLCIGFHRRRGDNGPSVLALTGDCPGQAVDFSVNLTAPATPAITDRLQAEKSGRAVSLLYVEIKVQLPEARQILFQDDFSNPGSGWPSISNAHASANYSADGQCNSGSDWDKIDVPLRRNFSDVSMEVDATKTAGSDEDNFGMICRYQDEKNYYYFIVSGSGHRAIGKRQDGGISFLSDGGWDQSFSDAIKAGSATNHFRFDCQGSTFTLFVNGEQVASGIDTSFTSGEVGFTGGTSPSRIHIRNFVVYSPELFMDTDPIGYLPVKHCQVKGEVWTSNKRMNSSNSSRPATKPGS